MHDLDYLSKDLLVWGVKDHECGKKIIFLFLQIDIFTFNLYFLYFLCMQ